ncbi:hypothetical protein F2P81_009206 [Scophthalmus maximus]|uniref:FBA domain-containing protein n=1 Tax=Scophthalmus maximus TaxID=52904 RepID=A0A6A4T986_SCOMX|nr:hypothetical protein F2P81_009206 [Scophthalmus maximus]
MSAAEFRKKFEAEWSLIGAPMPDSLDWKSVYEAKPLGRNLLRNPAPFGTTAPSNTSRWPCRWFSMEQVVDLKAEGLWEEMLDEFQPEIVIQDWYEESQLHEFIYQLHVKLLGADKSTVISEHTVNPTEDCSIYSHTWKEVSHVFSSYGPGVRYVQFLHRLKNSFMVEFFPTLFTGSSVIVRPVKTSS